MVYVPVRSIIPSLKLGDFLSVQAHKPCNHALSFLTCLSNDSQSSFLAGSENKPPPPSYDIVQHYPKEYSSD